MIECSIPHQPTYDGICIDGCLYYQAIVDRGSRVHSRTADRDELTGESRYMEMWLLVDAEKHEWSRHVYVFPSSWGNVAGEAQLYYIGMSGNNEVLLSPRYPSSPFYVFYYSFERRTIRRVEIQNMDALKYGRIHTFLDHVEDVKLYTNV
ncbi:hypothetical protein YC2023_028035 [Brassica napus]